jgi:tetratricopeptide (TPR) repeat protein
MQRNELAALDKLLKPVLAANPGAYDLARLLAESQFKRGNKKASAEIMVKAAKASGEAKHLLEASSAAQQWGEIVLAAQALDELIVKEPKNVEARLRLASLLRSYGDSGRAQAVVGPVLAIDPDNLPALELVASMQLGALARIVDLSIFHRLLKVSPDRRRALSMLAMAERYAGDIQSAVQHSLESLDPMSAESCASHADLLELAGRGDEALKLLEPHGKGTGPLSANVGMVLSRLYARTKRHEEALSALDRALASPDLQPASVSSISLKRGSALDKLGRSAEAWDAFTYAKLIQAGAYDATADRRRCEAIFEAFSGERRQRLAKAKPAEPRPLLVLGMYRSGTTLLEQILTMHTQVGGADEVPYFLRLAAAVLSTKDWESKWTDEEVEGASRNYRGLLRHGNPDKPVVVDKNPRNWEAVGLISLACPEAVVVHMDRHPLDVCVSCMATGFAASNVFAAEPRSFAQGYALQAEVMEKWKRDAPLPIMTLRYEDLVREPERRIREVLEFAGLAWEPACLDFWKSDRLAYTPSQDQVREPLNPRSIGRWKRFDRQLQPARSFLEELGISCAER